ncbi:hypothetical protein A2797_00715 [candidate division WWE3 bacterium RIFCSPHIGHO2_01_FULL_48_15]|uniref:Four helix bundle protein n=1 Tax=candidate division WWE3 bacterium RIFCSPHIGHO2_01_FULL_48_15 TaxID=1802619 RepID=A0A1F4VBZ9_UNCKA|nr:MAG: hypothetical protein A2797_00715 [candidate division WWE3 bacterium RIFCSPHIGHO2_01_FULL_48_15]
MVAEPFKFENLQVYQRTRKLVNEIYLLTGKWPREYLFDLTSQFRRAVLSILLNIAEGTGRSKADFARFLNIAIGSCKECAAIAETSFDLNLISASDKEKLKKEFIEITMMLEGLKKSLR